MFKKYWASTIKIYFETQKSYFMIMIDLRAFNHTLFFIRIIFIRIIRLKSWKIKNHLRITQGSDPAQSQLWTLQLHSKYEIIEYFGPLCSLLHLQGGPHGYFLPYLHRGWRQVSCHLKFKNHLRMLRGWNLDKIRISLRLGWKILILIKKKACICFQTQVCRMCCDQ